MKIIIIITYILFFTLFDNDVKITVVDKNSNELLIGVKDLNTNKYTDLNGELLLNCGSSIDLELISYEKINVRNIKNDTIIYLNPIK